MSNESIVKNSCTILKLNGIAFPKHQPWRQHHIMDYLCTKYLKGYYQKQEFSKSLLNKKDYVNIAIHRNYVKQQRIEL